MHPLPGDCNVWPRSQRHGQVTIRLAYHVSMSTATEQTPPWRPHQASSPGNVGLLMGSTYALWRRQVLRFVRQRSRIVGALATPVVFWLLLGLGLNRHFSPAGELAGAPDAAQPGYLAFFFPGSALLIVLFTAMFSTFSVIEDRQQGFLRNVLASPCPRLAIVLGQVCSGASLAMIQAGLFLLIWPTVAGSWSITGMLASLAMLAVASAGLTALGLILAWRLSSTAALHALLNVLLMPMWLLSGAVFPITDQTVLPLRVLMYVNPLTYGQHAVAGLLTPGESPWSQGPGVLVASLVTIALSLLAIAGACRVVARPGRDS